eukprot:3907880-Prymnesium_polylepis.1
MAGRGREEGGAKRHIGSDAASASQLLASAARAASHQVSTPSTAHKHCTRTCTQIGGAHGIRSDVLSGARAVSNKISVGENIQRTCYVTVHVALWCEVQITLVCIFYGKQTVRGTATATHTRGL